MDLSQVASKFSGFVKPTDKYKGGYESVRVKWKTIDDLCTSLPRSVQFELMDIGLAGDCSEEHLSIEVLEGKAKKKMGPFCQKDLDQVPPAKRVATFVNITQVTFVFATKNKQPGRGFLLKFLGKSLFPALKGEDTDCLTLDILLWPSLQPCSASRCRQSPTRTPSSRWLRISRRSRHASDVATTSSRWSGAPRK